LITRRARIAPPAAIIVRMEHSFDILSAIETKKRGGALSKGDWHAFLVGFLAKEIPDYQASALLMTVVLRGMTDEETFALTEAVWRSGESLSFPNLDRPLVDKHSTGGVGDKVTPFLVPLLVAAGCAVCKMSGRGLGHTGGTIDKLESIPGFRTSLTLDEVISQVESIGGAIVGQTGNLAPADKKLYALRDVTGTVDSIPLIVASIMGKKLAGGAGVIVLDVKVGDGAFFEDIESAQEFARLSVAVGRKFGRKVSCVLTRMDSPLGYAVGNALEMREVLDSLGGNAPRDLLEVTLALGSEVLLRAGLAETSDVARDKLNSLIDNRVAMRVFEDIVSAQGGSLAMFADALSELDNREKVPVIARETGRIARVHARVAGELSRALGAGRFTLDDAIDPFAGLIFAKKPGDYVSAGETWAACYFDPANPTVCAKLGETKEEASAAIGDILEPAIEIVDAGDYQPLESPIIGIIG